MRTRYVIEVFVVLDYIRFLLSGYERFIER